MLLLQDFAEDMNGAPLLLDEFAESAREVSDCPELRDAAVQFLAARDRFEAALASVGVEVG